jgi:hypothetical protein
VTLVATALSIQTGELSVEVIGAHLHVHSVILWGFIATAVLTAIMSAGQELGLSRLGLPFMLGTIFTRTAGGRTSSASPFTFSSGGSSPCSRLSYSRIGGGQTHGWAPQPA